MSRCCLSLPCVDQQIYLRYLEDVLSVVSYRPQAPKSYGKLKPGAGKRNIREEYQAEGYTDSIATAIQNIIRSDRIDYQVCGCHASTVHRLIILSQLIASLVDHIINTAEAKGGILIFLPGVNEIRQCIDAIRQTIQDKSASVFPLHANLSNEEQRRVFQQTKSWKIIAATNVAEVRVSVLDMSEVTLIPPIRHQLLSMMLCMSSTQEKLKKLNTIPRRACLCWWKRG